MYKVNIETFNDGLLYYGSVEAVKNAKKEKTGETFTERGHLFYKKLTVRDSDNIVASQMGYKIDLKVKVYKRDVNTQDKVKIVDDLYDIVNLDHDNRYSYVYLQKVGVKNGI